MQDKKKVEVDRREKHHRHRYKEQIHRGIEEEANRKTDLQIQRNIIDETNTKTARQIQRKRRKNTEK